MRSWHVVNTGVRDVNHMPLLLNSFYCLLRERHSACHTLSCFLPPFFTPCLQGEYCLLTLLGSSVSTDTLLCLRGSLSLVSVVCLFTILCTMWVRNFAYSSCAFILIVTAVSSKDALLLCAVLHVKPAKEATRRAVSRDTCRDNAEGTMAQSNVEKNLAAKFYIPLHGCVQPVLLLISNFQDDGMRRLLKPSGMPSFSIVPPANTVQTTNWWEHH